MKRLQLIAITRPQECLPSGMRAVVSDDLAAIYAPLIRIGRLTRRRALRAAAQRQRYLEELLPTGAVLPILPGQHLPSAEAMRMLRANASPLLRKLSDLQGRIQYQITLSIDENRAMQALSGRNGPFAAATDLEALKRLIVDHLQERLHALGCDHLALPVADGLVLNFVVLVDAASEAALHDVIAEVDAFWPSGFGFRVIGPSPAVSFASVAFQKTGKADLARALAILRLPGPGDASELARARSAALRGAYAPVEQVRLAADIVAAAGRLREDEAFPFHRVRFWAEGTALINDLSLEEAA